MSRASWGGQADLSGLFSGLINENFNAIKAGINEALADAQSEQAAADQKMQARWTAGKISDEQWLDYIRSRVQDSTDPEERSQWQQILLQNQDAISDAQWETKFQQNKITVGQLMTHYHERMSGIRKNSPAYRELVNRQSELQQFKRSGGVYYKDQYASSGGSSGGGGGSYSSGGSSGSSGSGGKKGKSLQDIITEGLKGGPTDVGYLGGEVFNTRGPNVLGVEFGQPATSSMSSMFVAVQDGLTGTQNRLEAFFDFLELNPTATAYTFPGTGQVLPINFKTVRAADEQYMRVTQTKVDVAHKDGDMSEVGYQEGLLTSHVTETMRNHNMMFNQSSEDDLGAWTRRTWARLNAAATPEERQKIAAEAGQAFDKYMEKHFPEYVITRFEHETAGKGREGFKSGRDLTGGEIVKTTPTTQEDQLPPEVYAAHTGLRQMIDIVENPQNYTDEDINTIFDSTYDLVDIGSGGNMVRVADLMGGSNAYATAGSTIGEGSLGAGDFRQQYIGLGAADLIQQGFATPDDFGDVTLFTYQWNSNSGRMEAVEALATPQADGSFEVLPAAVDSSGNLTPATNATRYMTSVNGKQTEVWTPIIDSAPAGGYVYRASDSITLQAGDKKVAFTEGQLIPSSVLAGMDAFRLNQMVTSGQFYKDAPPGVRQADIGGRTWFYDSRVNTWSPTPPWDLEPDGTDPNAIFVTDPDYTRNENGEYSVDPASWKGDEAYIGLTLAPGVQGYIVPFDGSMDPRQMQQWLETQIASGEIIPEEYLTVDAEGELVGMTQDDLMSLYFDKEIAARADALKKHRTAMGQGYTESFNQAQGDPAVLMQKARQDAMIEGYEKNFDPRNMGGTFPTTQAPLPDQQSLDADRMRQIEQIAFNLGVRTGVTPQPAVRLEAAVNRLDDNQLRLAALTAAQAREGVAAQPRLRPLPADKPKPVLNPIRRTPLERANEPVNLVGVRRTRRTRAQQSAIDKMTRAGQENTPGGFNPGLP